MSVCKRGFSVGFGPGLDSMSPARRGPGLRRGRIRWIQFAQSLLTVAYQPRAGCIRLVPTIWSPLASDTNINKHQITQNTALRIATGCTTDTNTHLHDETQTLSIKEHLQLHASQIRQKSQHPTTTNNTQT